MLPPVIVPGFTLQVIYRTLRLLLRYVANGFVRDYTGWQTGLFDHHGSEFVELYQGVPAKSTRGAPRPIHDSRRKTEVFFPFFSDEVHLRIDCVVRS